MTHDNRPRLLALLNRLGHPAGPADARLSDDLGMSSLDVAELACGVEREFAIALPIGAETRWRTVGDVLAAVTPAPRP